MLTKEREKDLAKIYLGVSSLSVTPFSTIMVSASSFLLKIPMGLSLFYTVMSYLGSTGVVPAEQNGTF